MLSLPKLPSLTLPSFLRGASPNKAITQPTVDVAIATMARALRQAAGELGYQPSDTLIALMISQMLGAEGAMPGLWNGAGYTLRGTNNIGASQVPGAQTGPSFAASHPGWGAFAHKDSNPGGDNYLGWYMIAPSVLESARHWLTGYGAVTTALQQGPQDPESYATVMYDGHYFTGTTTDAQSEIDKYASRIAAVLPRVEAAMNGPSNDPSLPSVDTTLFAPLSARQITQDLYDKAMAGQSGSAWKWLLPPWSTIVANNGVVWFGGPPSSGIVQKLGWIGTGALVGAGAAGPPGALAGGAIGYLHGAGLIPAIPGVATAKAKVSAAVSALRARL